MFAVPAIRRQSCLVVVFFLLFLSLFSIGAHAATLVVTNANDSGAGSLRETIATANAGDVIVFDNSYAITLLGSLILDKNLTIDGSGHIVSISGDAARQAFIIETGPSAITLRALIIEDTIAGDSTSGGAITINFGDSLILTIESCAFNRNQNLLEGGGGSAIFASGVNLSLNIIDSSFTENAADYGGAIYLQGASNTLAVQSSFFSDNNAIAGGAIYTLNTPNIGIKTSTFVYNRSYALTNFVIVKSIGYNQKTYDFY
jgi:hypothetical protein